MSDDHPLGLRRSASRTKIRSIGQGTPPPAASGAVASTPMTGPTRRPTTNPFFEAFGEVLDVIPDLSRAEPPSDPETLRLKLHDRILRGRDRAVALGVDGHRARQAAWMVAALADDLAINTPWGARSVWPNEDLTFLLEDRGGDTGVRFFDDLAELSRFADRDPELLTLAYTCLTLGFLGKYRQADGSAAPELLHLMAEIGRVVAGPRADARLSLRWEGATVPDAPRRAPVPLWVMVLGAATILTLTHAGLSATLTHKAAAVEDVSALVPPLKRAEIVRTISLEREATPPPENFETPEINLLSEFVLQTEALAPVLDEGRSTDDPLATRLVLQATNPELFRSGKATINPPYEDFIARVAEVILEYDILIARVTVLGHTDSIPVQSSNPFTNNQRLSEARAGTVRDLLLEHGLPENFVIAEGKGASDPIDTNGTSEGRARNRRVEILLQKTIAK
ncbi:MAG: type IVB secretion system protein IcmH/DotU [Paracoccaceae bacterium]|nr:type IVB secretion system protein IcmH/DotU [Paracoccaceae bacterium]